MNQEDEKWLDKVMDIAFEKLEEVDDDYSLVEEPFQTIAIIIAAQGVIDNGGLRYFFDYDWPRNPPYSVYADAYRRIGCERQAVAIEVAASSFGVADPQNQRELRRKYIEAHYNEKEFNVDGWPECMYTQDGVEEQLVSWARSYSK
ncbi:MAG TPA: hypothetical protein PK402_10015 [Tepidisphaeraceae bacterium]|nr:hypothetical protein [Tepidisphaeraceae bacterium]